MNYPANDPHYVRCLKCQKVLKCSRYDTSTLLDHIRADHPDIDIVDSSVPSPGNGAKWAPKTPPKSKSSQGSVCDCANVNCPDQLKAAAAASAAAAKKDTNVVYTRSYKVSAPSTTVQTPRKRSLYRTSIETWRPANGTIYCPKCGCKKRPLIKSHSERSATNSCGAACILSCWPFCFIPYICTDNQMEYLYCANCKNFLGVYDREHNCVKPNRVFTDQETADSTQSSNTKNGQYV